MIRRSVKRRSVVAGAALASASVAALVLGACGEPSEAERRRDLADDLVRESDGVLGRDEARCVADGLVDAFGVDSLDAIVAVAEGGDDPDDVRAQVVDVFTECDALGVVAVAPDPEPPDEPDEPDGGG